MLVPVLAPELQLESILVRHSQSAAELPTPLARPLFSLQAVFVFALLPVMTMVRGMTLAELPGYVARGEPAAYRTLKGSL